MSVDAFVSYATPDRAITMALVEDLESRGLKCWVAPRDVPGGSKYAEVILNALAEAKVFLLVFSENSNKSEHVQREVERGLHASKTIVPVRIADVLPSGAMDYYLATLHWIDAFGAAKVGSFDMVASAMAGVLGRELIEPDEAVGADAVPVDSASLVDGANFSGSALQVAAPAQYGESKRQSSKSGNQRNALIIAGAAAVLLAAGAVVAWKADSWIGDGSDGISSAAANSSGGGEGQSAPDEPGSPGQLADAAGKDGETPQAVEAGKPADASSEPDALIAAAAAKVENGVDQSAETGATPKSGSAGNDSGSDDGEKMGSTGDPIGQQSPSGNESGDGVEKAGPLMTSAKVNLAGQHTDLIVAADSHGGPIATMPAEGKRPEAKPKPKPPPDPIAEAVTAAQKAWQSGERKQARESWLLLLRSPQVEDLSTDRLGERALELLSEMVFAAADDAEGKGDAGAAAAAFAELDEWKVVVDFSEKLGLDDLENQRARFQLGWQVAQAEHFWASGSREAAAKILADIAGRGAQVLSRINREQDFVGNRLAALLGEVTKLAAEGHLGTSEVLTEKWLPSLQLAADSGDVSANAVLATMAWKMDDRERTADLLQDYEKATRGADSLHQGVSSLLGEAVTQAQAELLSAAAGEEKNKARSLLTEAWEPAFNVAYRSGIEGALEVLAEVTHRRDPGEAVALYRRLYERVAEAGSLRKRFAFCLQMLERYELGEEANFYRGQLQEACELTLGAMDQPSSGGELIEEIPEIRDAANAGVPAAQYIMADLMVNGKGVERDDEAAFAFYRKAADGGYARAKYAVGECLRDGRGTEKDVAEAVRIWRSMTDEEVAEVPQALFNLAELLPDGAEKRALIAEARKHYTTKVEDGKVAMYGGVLGYMLVAGSGGPADPKRGFQYLREAAEHGSSYAAFRAAFILTGEEPIFVDIREAAGIERDVEAGQELMKQAARDGFPEAIEWCEVKGVDFAE